MSINEMGCGYRQGTYLWHNDGIILTLKEIEDPCINRLALFSTAMGYARP